MLNSINPTHGQWFELHNTASMPFSLNGLFLNAGLNDGSGLIRYNFAPTASIAADGYLTVGKNNASGYVNLVWSNLPSFPKNGTSAIPNVHNFLVLTNPSGTPIDAALWNINSGTAKRRLPFSSTPGMSLSRKIAAGTTQDPNNWAPSTAYAACLVGNDKATPGEVNSKICSITKTKAPTKRPTKAPTKAPTKKPTKAPTKKPTKAPTKGPTKEPTKTPTKAPTAAPTKAPAKAPTKIADRRSNESSNESSDCRSNQSTNQNADRRSNESSNDSSDFRSNQSTNQNADRRSNESSNESSDQSANQSAFQSSHNGANCAAPSVVGVGTLQCQHQCQDCVVDQWHNHGPPE